MKAYSKLALLREHPLEFTNKVLNRLGFFPFTLLYLLFNAALEAVLPRTGRGFVRLEAVAGQAMRLPRDIMIWLASDMTGPAKQHVDVCLELPREESDANLHDVLSVILTFHRIRSVGLYWDSSCLADDLPLLQAKQNPGVSVSLNDALGHPGFKQIDEFLNAAHEGITLPVAATRDAQTLLKRQAGGAYAVCLNVPQDLRALADAAAAARPDVRFVDFSPALPPQATLANKQSIFGHGLTLHERMALVRAADAYVGSFDELGCTAVASGRPAILLGGGSGGPANRIGQAGRAVWYPGPMELEALTNAVRQFLSRHLAPGQEASATRDDPDSSHVG